MGTLLEKLDISRNPIREAGLSAIARGVRRCVSVRSLSARYVNGEPIEPDGRLEPLSLAPLLASTGLSTLILSHNFVGANSMSVGELREALANNTSITNLSLRRCCIGGWRRARAIARGLARNTVLTTVDLSYNGLGAASSQLHVAGGAGGQPTLPMPLPPTRRQRSDSLWLSKRSARLSALRPAFAASRSRTMGWATVEARQ